ncbi:MAG TPA: hypothetical protein VMT18_05365, partial [Planctomycetota bacterium]|nr:hypothetical protein [Planctomycetota bacterium]
DERRSRAHLDQRDRFEQARTDEDAARRFSAEPQPASQRAAAALEREPSSPAGPAADTDQGGLPQPHLVP